MDTTSGEINPILIKALVKEVLNEMDIVSRDLCDQRYNELVNSIDKMESQLNKITSKVDRVYFTLISLTVSIAVATITLLITTLTR